MVIGRTALKWLGTEGAIRRSQGPAPLPLSPFLRIALLDLLVARCPTTPRDERMLRMVDDPTLERLLQQLFQAVIEPLRRMM